MYNYPSIFHGFASTDSTNCEKSQHFRSVVENLWICIGWLYALSYPIPYIKDLSVCKFFGTTVGGGADVLEPMPRGYWGMTEVLGKSKVTRGFSNVEGWHSQPPHCPWVYWAAQTWLKEKTHLINGSYRKQRHSKLDYIFQCSWLLIFASYTIG